MPDPNRIRSIIQKHVESLSRELAQELAQELTKPLADRWGINLAEAGPAAIATSLEPLPATLVYDARTRRWGCPKCAMFSDLRRRSVTTHMRFCTGTGATAPSASKTQRKATKKKKS
jgi:hypothetical protein